MTERTYPDGVDCVWVACDRDGYLGAFVTGGAGPIPLQVLASEAVLVEDLEARVELLPRITGARLLVPIKRPDDFVAMAERGLFVYDWTDVQRTRSESIHAYEPVAAPERPVKIEAIPEHVVPRSVCPRLDVAFVDATPLDVRKHLSCREVG
jgi:hypothetical protein